jgi:hypothetical protein
VVDERLPASPAGGSVGPQPHEWATLIPVSGRTHPHTHGRPKAAGAVGHAQHRSWHDLDCKSTCARQGRDKTDRS